MNKPIDPKGQKRRVELVVALIALGVALLFFHKAGKYIGWW